MNVKVTDEQWQKILLVLKSFHPEIRLAAGRDCRRFLEAGLWITRSGSQWRLLPTHYGNWNSVFKRFHCWSELGVFEKLFEHFSADRDARISLDRFNHRAFPRLVLPERKKHDEQALGRSRGGQITQDSLGDGRLWATPFALS
jgi:transposase